MGRTAKDPRSWQVKIAKDKRKCGQCTNFVVLRSNIRCDTNSRRTEYENLYGGKDRTLA
jgi:hypothetical protein